MAIGIVGKLDIIERTLSSLPEITSAIADCGNKIADVFHKKETIGLILKPFNHQPIAVIDLELYKTMTSVFKDLKPILIQEVTRDAKMQKIRGLVQNLKGTLAIQSGLTFIGTALIIYGLGMMYYFKDESANQNQEESFWKSTPWNAFVASMGIVLVVTSYIAHYILFQDVLDIQNRLKS